MANPGYVRSTDGNDAADDGSTWALANASLAGAIADAAAGDRIWVSDNHAESTASPVTLTFPGTAASPNQVLCGDDASEPPTALATTATVATTSTNALTVNGVFYAYGITFSSGTGASTAGFTIGSTDTVVVLDACKFTCGTTAAVQRVLFGSNSNGSEMRAEIINCTFKFGNASQGISIGHCNLSIKGGSIDGTGSAITVFIATATANSKYIVVDGFDFSNAAASMSLIAASSVGQGPHIFRNCKMPTSWSGGLFVSAPTLPGCRGEMWNCSATDTNYAMWVEDYAGSIKHETTLVRTGGASDGDTPISWKMATSANAEYPTVILRSPEIYVPNTTTGASKTLTVEILHDSATNLKDNEIWLEVQYLGTSGVPLALFIDDAVADVLAAAADQTTSSETWTTTGMTNPNKQKLAVTFTPQEKGVIHAVVRMAKASYTVYVDPVLTVA